MRSLLKEQIHVYFGDQERGEAISRELSFHGSGSREGISSGYKPYSYFMCGTSSFMGLSRGILFPRKEMPSCSDNSLVARVYMTSSFIRVPAT